MLWIRKGYSVVKKLVWNDFIKAIVYKIYYLSKFITKIPKHLDLYSTMKNLKTIFHNELYAWWTILLKALRAISIFSTFFKYNFLLSFFYLPNYLSSWQLFKLLVDLLEKIIGIYLSTWLLYKLLVDLLEEMLGPPMLRCWNIYRFYSWGKHWCFFFIFFTLVGGWSTLLKLFQNVQKGTHMVYHVE